MISRLQALGFRSLRHVSQELQPFQVLVGPNGSGKSGFLDIVGFIGDLLRVGPLRAILGDTTNNVASRAADPSHLCFMRRGQMFELAVDLRVPDARASLVTAGRYERARYEVAIQTTSETNEVRIVAETLWLIDDKQAAGSNGASPFQRSLFPYTPEPPSSIVRGQHQAVPKGWRHVVRKIGEQGNDYFRAETSNWQSPFRLGPTKSALANLPEDETRFPISTWVKRVLMEGVERIVLDAEAMRSPSPPGAPSRLRPDGSNLPWAVEHLRENDPDRFARWVDHVRTALPDLTTIETVERSEDRHRYLVVSYANGLRAPSWIVSDGTLRLLALTLLAFLCEADSIFLIEEPENGIHPKAIEVIYESLSSAPDAQILCASHSPVVLGMADRSALLCFAKDEAGATDVVSGTEHPRLRDWKGTLDLGTLFAAGVLG